MTGVKLVKKKIDILSKISLLFWVLVKVPANNTLRLQVPDMDDLDRGLCSYYTE